MTDVPNFADLKQAGRMPNTLLQKPTISRKRALRFA